ncbi:MAG: Rne/Rng family ribonuclease [Acetobacteraceae bacterium]|nr:Rne/Rng family ribonuclease [Acetobacteraceae bacterium]
MTKRMLIDASHAEETRVVLLDGNVIEDYDIETAGRRQLKGNIYLAKVVRVEPSLQAAFVEYGGNRHGFLAFGEIHPDYYQMPVADRQRLLEMQEAEAREEEEAEDRAAERQAEAGSDAEPDGEGDPATAVSDPDTDAAVQAGYALRADPDAAVDALSEAGRVAQAAAVATEMRVASEEARDEFPPAPAFTDAPEGELNDAVGADLALEAAEPATENPSGGDAQPSQGEELLEGPLTGEVLPADDRADHEDALEDMAEDSGPAPETVGGEGDERRERRSTPRFLRNYKIQEVIRRRQILLVQVVKEERGTKGAALTTYISLAGRFSVLMPNSPRGGGISRKITSASDRRRLKEVTAELDLPRGMGLIVRTAGANRPKAEIMRDCEYLLNQWDQIRDLTMRSVAPALIYEEASLIKRAMRDLYSREVEEVLVEGEAGWKAARDFMRMLMPDAARKVQLWREPQPLFTKANVEQQLDAMLAPTVQLRSGGYLVINQAEALVAIDVNSGRSTRERGIEETALRTNLEAAEEIARQLRLRDLAGLIVMDFIDMESRRHNAMVERRLKEALKNDRARIQVGSISHFGLLEMSRQRLRPSLVETNFVPCPHCGGLGHVRGVESSALHVLRAVEDEGARRKAAEILVHCAAEVALYILNHKRARLAEIEARFAMRVTFAADGTLLGAQVRVDRLRTQTVPEAPAPISQAALPEAEAEEDEPAAEAEGVEKVEAEAPGDDGEQRRRRRRRRSRARGRAETVEGEADTQAAMPSDAHADAEAAPGEAPSDAVDAGVETSTAPLAEEPAAEETGEQGRKRRGRRGGRRRRREGEVEAEAAEPEVPAYAGPTPADPFGGSVMDIFDVLEQAEEQRANAAGVPMLETAAEPALEPLPEPPGAAEAPETEAFAQHATAEADTPPEPELASVKAAVSAEAVSAEPAEEADGADASVLPEFAAPDVASPDPADIEPVESEPAPAIVPVLVGVGETPAAPKRGWWRR